MSPHAPLRPCLHVGCGALVRSGRCAKHRTSKDAGARDKSQGLYWSRRWRERFRPAILEQRPFCEQCMKEGRPYVPARCVDHIEPLAEVGFDRAFDPDAVQSLCWRHHSIKTRRENAMGGYRELKRHS